MRNKFVLLVIIFFTTRMIGQNAAPSDYTLNTAINNTNGDVYIQFSTNSNLTINQTGWDIAFHNNVYDIGGKINSSKGVRAWRVFKDTSNFNSLSLSDTLYQVYNNDSFMFWGALDTIYTGSLSTWFNIGLGRFIQGTTNYAYGTHCYIIQTSNGGYQKFYLQYYASRKFDIIVSNIDNSNRRKISVTKELNSAHYKFVNLNMDTQSLTFEPFTTNWDILLRPNVKDRQTANVIPWFVSTNNAHNILPYSKSLNAFSDNIPSFYFTPVNSTEAYMHIGDPLTATYNNSLNGSSVKSYMNNQIGSKWLSNDGKQARPGVSFFIKDRNSFLYHLIFTNFNSTTNELNYAFRKIGTASVFDNNLENQYDFILENNSLTIESIKNMPETILSIYTVDGKSVYQENFQKRVNWSPMDGNPKIYFIKLENQLGTQIRKFVF